jgi:hypothetical protein
MNGLLSSWYFRAGIVAGLTWLAYRYVPVAGAGKTAIIALGAVSIAGILSSNVPLVGQVLAGRLPMPVAPSTPTT